MDQSHMPGLIRSMTGPPSRRDVVRALAAAVLGAVGANGSGEAEARRRRKRKKRRKRCGEGGPCRVFVTSTEYGGVLGGLAGADAICQTLASQAGLPGAYKAWLSDSTASPSTRFVRSRGPYRLLDGTRIADNWEDLTDGLLAAPIDVTESGGAVAGSTGVWTHTEPEGTARSGDDHCGNWSSASGDGDTGTHTVAGDDRWTQWGADPCNTGQHLYCFQQR
jgi:hypothetical protein